MTDHAMIFDAVVRANSGGRYGRLGALSGDVGSPERFVFNHTREQIARRIPSIQNLKGSVRQRPGIYFDFVDDFRLNALSFSHDSFGYMGIHKGAVHLLHDVFCRVFSHPKLFLRTGNVSVESVRPIHSEPLSDDYEFVLSQRPANAGGLDYVIPNDADRANVAAFVALIALDFLSEHEFGHLCHGHCEYQRPLGLSIISELRLAGGKPVPDNLTMQFLEYQADQFALYSSLHSALHTPFPSIANPSTERGKKGRLILWQFAVMTLFWMLGLDFDENDMEAESHPFPVVRIMAVQATTSNLLKEKFPELVDYFDAISGRTVFETAMAMKTISGNIEDQNYSRAVKATNGPILQHVQRIWNRGREIADDLAKVSYCRPWKWESIIGQLPDRSPHF